MWAPVLGAILVLLGVQLLRVSDEVGCRCIITDAYRDRVGWYAKYGFIPIEGPTKDGPQKRFIDVRTIRVALKSGSVQG